MLSKARIGRWDLEKGRRIYRTERGPPILSSSHTAASSHPWPLPARDPKMGPRLDLFDGLAFLNPRVEYRIYDIDDEVHNQYEHRHYENYPCQKIWVAVLNGLNR